VVAALTALPDLQHLTWRRVQTSGHKMELPDSKLLQRLTRLTGLDIRCVDVQALQQLSLTKLQHLNIECGDSWAAAGYPGLQELKGLTCLGLKCFPYSFPATVSQFTALQQLEVSAATTSQLNDLTALSALTNLCVLQLSLEPTPLRLSALQHLELGNGGLLVQPVLPGSYLANCTQLRRLLLGGYYLTGPGSHVASSMLQQLDIQRCSLSSPDGTAGLSAWELLFPAPGQLPHLTSCKLHQVEPKPHPADVERLVACCSSLQLLQLDGLQDSELGDSGVSALTRLPYLTTLIVSTVDDQQCSSLAQLTGLRQLKVHDPQGLSPVGLRHLARIEQFTRLGFLCSFDPQKVSTMLEEQLSDDKWNCSHALVNKASAVC